jgi:hypothetical protein
LTSKYNNIRQQWHLAGYVLTKKHACIIGCICEIFQLNRSINPEWQVVGCPNIPFSERHEEIRELCRKMSATFREMVW